MSTEATSFVVAVEMTNEYVQKNGSFVDWLCRTNKFVPLGNVGIIRFRGPTPINGIEVLAPGCTLRNDEPDPSNDASLQRLTNKLLARLRRPSTRRDEPEDTGQDDNECYQPSPEEQGVHFAQEDSQDEPPRAPFNPDEPNITAAWSGTERQHESRPRVEIVREMPAPFQWMEAAEILAPLPPRPWISKGFQLGPGRVTVFGGAAGSGKTAAAQGVGIAVMTGESIFRDFSFKVDRRGAVGHLDNDQGEYDSRERWQQLCNANGVSHDELIQNRLLRYKHRPKLHAADPKSIDAWKWVCDGLALLIIDALAQLMPGIDPNSPQFADGLYMLGEVSECAGTSIIIPAHTGKPKDGPQVALEHMIRGTSAILAAAGATYVMAIDTNGNRIVRMVKKALGTRGHHVESFALPFKNIEIPGSEIGGLLITTETIEQVTEKTAKKKRSDTTDANVKMVVQYVLVASRPCTKSMVNENAGIMTSRAKAARDQAEGEGYITHDSKDGYTITDKGKALLGLTPNAPQDAPDASDTTANPTDTTKGA